MGWLELLSSAITKKGQLETICAALRVFIIQNANIWNHLKNVVPVQRIETWKESYKMTSSADLILMHVYH